jgi:LuxR family transcriptional regulator, maltose regulon positive regulatory protein
MGTTAESTVASGRSHIIERPRLTRLLDETSARVIMLVAPAGYGKTTLARQWLANRPHAWYQANTSSNDVAALALGVVRAAETQLPNIGRRLKEWLPTSHAPEHELDVLVDMVTEELDRWPDDAWFVLDDYHLLSSGASEDLARRLFGNGDRRVVVTSRSRPAWASAREFLYGHAIELGQPTLAMSMEEAQSVLSSQRGAVAEDLAILAGGWPAVIGLAALAPTSALVAEDHPDRLDDYFAEEVFAALRDDAQSGIMHLALLPEVTPEAAASVIGPRFEEVLRAARAAGLFVAHVEPTPKLHPLLQAFLRKKLTSSSRNERAAIVERTTRYLLESGKWDDAFAVIERFEEDELLDELVSRALQVLLREGRLATIIEWINFARRRGISSPSVDLADAEISFRSGLHKRAFILARTTATASNTNESLRSTAYYRAGQTALLSDDAPTALQLFGRAQKVANTAHDLRSALWGEFVASIELERPSATDTLQEFAAVKPADLASMVRLANGRLILGITRNGLDEAIAEATKTDTVVDDVEDPMVRSGFRHIFAAALVLAGRYVQAKQIVDRALSDIERSGIEFARPHTMVTRATASIGLAQNAQAEAALSSVEESARARQDEYLATNARLIRSRLLLEQGAAEEALRLISLPWNRLPSRSMQGEYLATRAAAIARNGDLEEAERVVELAQACSRCLQPQFLVCWVRAICGLLRGETDAAQVVHGAYERTIAAGPIDTFVFAYRIEPRILLTLSQEHRYRESLSSVLSAACDSDRAADHGLPVFALSDPPRDEVLTPREQDVYSLLALGKTNREIAASLVITEPTAKVHVRNILRKLGVRSRTEAALLAAREEPKRDIADRR